MEGLRITSDDELRARVKALEMTTFVLFAALAAQTPAEAAAAISRLLEWTKGQQDEVQAVLRHQLVALQGHLAGLKAPPLFP